MPITLDSFRAAIESKTDTGFVEFSARKNKVDTYGTNFFARHFGWYSTRSAETNREVRQQFYNALSEPGRCQENVLAAIKSRLGLEKGNAVKDHPLSIREIRTMMAWANNSTRAVTFNRPASQEFADTLLQSFQSTVQQQLNLPENTSYEKLWTQTARDINRVGLGLKINDTTLCHVMDCKAFSQANLKQTIEDTHKAFQAKVETQNDKVAERILAGLLHQGVSADFQIATQMTGATMPELGTSLFADHQHVSFPCRVQRQDDGSYDIDVNTTINFLSRTNMDEKEYYLGDSQISFNAKLKLSFENDGTPKLEFRNQELPTIQGTFHKCDFNTEELDLMTAAMDGEIGDSNSSLPFLMNAPELMHNPELRTKMDDLVARNNACLQNPNDENLTAQRNQGMKDLKAFMKGHLITQNDQKMLENLGIDNSIFTLLSGNWGGTGRIDRKLMNQLTGQNELEFAKGIATLQKMCHELHNLGITGEEIVVAPLNKALVTIGGFSLNGRSAEVSDAGLLVNYARLHPEERLLEDLNAWDQDKVNNAKDRLKNVLPDERKKVGQDILINQYEFEKSDLNVLETKLGKEALNSMMEHIYQQDAEMESTLNTLRQTLKAN